MTIYELAQRDLKKAIINLEHAKKRPNVPKAELEHLARLVCLRQEILAKIGRTSDGETV